MGRRNTAVLKVRRAATIKIWRKKLITIYANWTSHIFKLKYVRRHIGIHFFWQQCRKYVFFRHCFIWEVGLLQISPESTCFRVIKKNQCIEKFMREGCRTNWVTTLSFLNKQWFLCNTSEVAAKPKNFSSCNSDCGVVNAYQVKTQKFFRLGHKERGSKLLWLLKK